MTSSTTNQFFLDSNVLIASLDDSDVHHSRAKTVLRKIKDDEVFVSDIVVNETLTVMARRFSGRKRGGEFSDVIVKFKNEIRNFPIISVYEIVPAYYNQIMSFMTQYAARLSFHDCLIALFLAQVPDVTLVSFDADFAEVKGLKLLSN